MGSGMCIGSSIGAKFKKKNSAAVVYRQLSLSWLDRISGGSIEDVEVEVIRNTSRPYN